MWYLRMRCFFAGGSARCPLSKLEAYFSFEAMRLFWMSVMVVEVIVKSSSGFRDGFAKQSRCFR